MISLHDRILKESRPILLDGGTGAELEKRGVDVNHKLWSGIALINEPATLEKLHYDYYSSGSNAILTATYQLCDADLKDIGLDAESVYSKAIEVTKKAKDAINKKDNGTKPRYIIGSVGPYGASLADGSEYTGKYLPDVDEKLLAEFHYGRLKHLLLSDDIDMIGFETFPNFIEIKAVLNQFKKIIEENELINKSCYMSLSINDDINLVDGTLLSDIIKFLVDWKRENCTENIKLSCVGSNCCKLSESSKIVEKISGLLSSENTDDLKIVMYPNSGEVYDGITKEWHGASDKKDGSHDLSLVENVDLWLNTDKVGILGGCCRTGPCDILEINKALNGKY